MPSRLQVPDRNPESRNRDGSIGMVHGPFPGEPFLVAGNPFDKERDVRPPEGDASRQRQSPSRNPAVRPLAFRVERSDRLDAVPPDPAGQLPDAFRAHGIRQAQGLVSFEPVGQLAGNQTAALKAVRELRRLDPAKAENLFNLIVPR